MPNTTSSLAILLDKTGIQLQTVGFGDPKTMHWREIFRIDPSTEPYEEYSLLGGLGYPGPVNELGGPPHDELIPGPTKKLRPRRWGLYTTVSADLWEDATEMRSSGSSNRKVLDMNKHLGKSARSGIENQAADLFNNGFTTTYHTTADGKAIFATDHSLPRGGTFSNTSTAAALNFTNLLAAIYQLQNTTDGGGHQLFMGNGPLKLIVGRNMVGRAWELTQAGGKPDTADNTRNYMGKLDIQVVMHPYIEGNAWFVIAADEDNGFVAINRKPVTFSRDETFLAETRRYKVIYRIVFGNVRHGLGAYGNAGV